MGNMGNMGKWIELYKSKHRSKIEKGLFKNYIELISKIEEDIKKINDLEIEVMRKYPLLRSIPISSSRVDNEIYLEELILYINSKET